MPNRLSLPSPTVTGRLLDTLTDPSVPAPSGTRPSLRRALVVDLGHTPDPCDQAPGSAVLADHLARRAAAVDVMDAAGPLPCRPDLVVAFTPRLASAETAAQIARSTDARLLLVVQELLREPSATEDIPWAPPSVSDRERDVLAAASVVAISSETFRDAVRAYGVARHRIGVLPDWAHVVPTWLDRQEARRALGWPERGFIAVHTGMDSRHDVETVVEAARLAGPAVHLALVGDGRRMAEARPLAADVPNVVLAGPLDGELRPLTLVAADALVISESLPAGRLSQPCELASCLAAARPVVAAAAPGGVTQAELSRAEGAGIVVPAGAAAALADALLTLRADPARRVAMGLAALAHAEAQLSMHNALACFDELVDLALTVRPPACLCTV